MQVRESAVSAKRTKNPSYTCIYFHRQCRGYCHEFSLALPRLRVTKDRFLIGHNTPKRWHSTVAYDANLNANIPTHSDDLCFLLPHFIYYP